MRRMRLLAALALACPAMLAAQPIGGVVAARSAGQLGERFDGYLGFVVPSAGPLHQQVGAINIKRRALYSDLAARRGVSAQEVGVSTACILLSRVAVGEAYLLDDGVWRRRSAGEGAPHPSYCG